MTRIYLGIFAGILCAAGMALAQTQQGQAANTPGNASNPQQALSEQEKNKAIARSFFEEVLDQGHLDRYAESHAPDFVAHAGDHDATLAEDMAAAGEERKALPDMRVKIKQLVAEGDMVVVYWNASGTNLGEGMGFPATGKKIAAPGMTLFRFKNGKISEEWSVFDMSAIMQQARPVREAAGKR